MSAIQAYIDPQNHPNVGIYGIHGVSGLHQLTIPFICRPRVLEPFSIRKRCEKDLLVVAPKSYTDGLLVAHGWNQINVDSNSILLKSCF